MNVRHEVLRVKSHFHPAAVHRAGDVVVRDAGAWTPTVHGLLRHLEAVGFAGAARVVGSGFETEGQEMLSHIEGEFIHPGPWTLDGAASVGVLLRQLHTATASFRAPSDAVWYPWFGRALGGPERIIGHCDVAPWNIVARDGRAVALIDWDRAGPVDPVVELAQACWLNAKLHDDLVAQREGLPSLQERARQLWAIVDGYDLPTTRRRGLMDRIVEFTVHDAADESDLAHITAETTPDQLDPQVPWALAWRVRAAPGSSVIAWCWNVRSPEPEEALAGGNMASDVRRVGHTVRRRAGPWTPAVHRLLRHLEQVDFRGAPRALGIDEQGRPTGKRLMNVSRLHHAGVRLTAGSDAGWRLTRFETFARELEEMASAGLSALEVIHSATGAASQATGHQDDFGTLRAGLSADLLLVDGNATEDIHCLASVRRVYLEGQLMVVDD